MPTLKNYRRYSLRTAMLLVTAVCLWLGWQAYLSNQQAQAIEQLRSLGGQTQSQAVSFSFLNIFNARTEKVVAINFLGPRAGDTQVDQIIDCASQLPHLQFITFTDTALTVEGERKLQRALPHLEVQAITTAFGIPSTI